MKDWGKAYKNAKILEGSSHAANWSYYVNTVIAKYEVEM